MRRGCEQYGIAIDYRPVRTPHYGGHIERLIGTMMGKVHLLPGTTYASIAAKGDTDPEKTAAMTIDELEQCSCRRSLASITAPFIARSALRRCRHGSVVSWAMG